MGRYEEVPDETAPPDEAAAPPAPAVSPGASRYVEVGDDVAPVNAAPLASAPADEPQPSAFASLFDRAKGVAKAAAQPFEDIGHGLMAANRFATQAIAHPIDTFGNAATRRELLRGVNSNIPFANKAVEAIGGIPAESPEDQAAATPGASAFGGVAGMPLGSMVGGIAAKGVEAAAPVAAGFVQKFAKAADERQVGRAMSSLEEKTYKRTRAGIRQGTVEDAVRENPELQKAAAAGNDQAVAKAADVMRKQAGSELAQIYKSAKPEIDDVTAPIANLDRRIAELRKGTSSDAEVARQLKTIRDELNDRLGTDDALNPQKLRAEQSDYQKKGYGKAMPGDDAATARIAANREASKAIGDAVVKHVTGMDYAAAKAYAEANPDSLAARLFKANDRVSAANRIDAGIADRSSRAVPEHGIKAAAKRIAHHAVLPAVVGASHGPTAGILAAAGQEALHAAPAAMRFGARTADAAIGRIAPAVARGIQAVPDSVMARTILDLMKRGVPQEAAIQMTRSGVVPPQAPMQPSLASAAPPPMSPEDLQL